MVIQLDAERCDQHNRRRDHKKNRRYEQIQQALAESLIKRKTTVSREQKRCIENMERFRFPYHNIRQLWRQIDTDFFRIAIFQQTVAQLRMKIAQDHALLTWRQSSFSPTSTLTLCATIYLSGRWFIFSSRLSIGYSP